MEMVRFECGKHHAWKDPMPTPEAPAMLRLFGICPVCPGRVQGTAKEDPYMVKET